MTTKTTTRWLSCYHKLMMMMIHNDQVEEYHSNGYIKVDHLNIFNEWNEMYLNFLKLSFFHFFSSFLSLLLLFYFTPTPYVCVCMFCWAKRVFYLNLNNFIQIISIHSFIRIIIRSYVLLTYFFSSLISFHWWSWLSSVVVVWVIKVSLPL